MRNDAYEKDSESEDSEEGMEVSDVSMELTPKDTKSMS